MHLSDSELKDLNAAVSRTGLCRESYIRSTLKKIRPRASPPLEYHQLKRELSAIGNNINQIAHVANSYGYIDAGRYDEEVQKYREYMKRLLSAVELPENIPDEGDSVWP